MFSFCFLRCEIVSPSSLAALPPMARLGRANADLYPSQNAVLVTGGEDSKLNVWSLEGPTVDDGDDAMELDDGADAANHTHDASSRGRKRGASWDDGDEMVS